MSPGARFFVLEIYFEPKLAIIRIKSMNQQLSPDLYDRVINRINYEHKLLLLKRKIFAYLTGFLLSFATFIPLLLKLHQDLIQSNFSQFFSLIFSDFNSVMSNISDFFWLMLESIPAASIAFTVLSLTIFVFSLVKFFNFWLEFRDMRQLKASQL
jgi:hypothetical protein